ncbi:Flp pilus assembly protein CpaB [Eggerthellaceae bacterium zg-1084]|uniref:Flp pilus assembly protein CpaB n=1 Tax=Berryella wangjianweii TaxID=2734634 RepID=UPI001554F165|nr:Flp pilus assembly protein CpaB [Berryella wangjianweii]NPD30730.1 Flp pilus assembly protein CpaB [Berryella wangjianweii]
MSRRKNAVLSIAFAAVAGVSAFMCVEGARSEAQASYSEALSRYGGEQVDVVVARRDLAPGQLVSASDVEVRTMVSRMLPEGAIRSVDEVAGLRPSSMVLAGEACSRRRFEQTTAGLEVPDGLSALSLQAKAAQAVGGAVRTGMRVDVYLAGDEASSLLCRRALVLATSAGAEGGSGTGALDWVTVAVLPEQVQQLVAASGRGHLCLTLPSDQASDPSSPPEPAPSDEERARARTRSARDSRTGGGSSAQTAVLGAAPDARPPEGARRAGRFDASAGRVE